jgi:hypothetical protein
MKKNFLSKKERLAHERSNMNDSSMIIIKKNAEYFRQSMMLRRIESFKLMLSLVEEISLESFVWYVMSFIAVFSSLRTRLSMLASVFTCVLDERCSFLSFSADKPMSCLQVWVFSLNIWCLMRSSHLFQIWSRTSSKFGFFFFLQQFILNSIINLFISMFYLLRLILRNWSELLHDYQCNQNCIQIRIFIRIWIHEKIFEYNYYFLKNSLYSNFLVFLKWQ